MPRIKMSDKIYSEEDNFPKNGMGENIIFLETA